MTDCGLNSILANPGTEPFRTRRVLKGSCYVEARHLHIASASKKQLKRQTQAAGRASQ